MLKTFKISSKLLKSGVKNVPFIQIRHGTCPCESKPTTILAPKPTQPKTPLELCSPKLIMDPKCKTAVITGGISGIGFAAASHLLHVGGRQVVIMGRDCCKGKESETFLNKTYGRNKAAFVKSNCLSLQETEDAFKEAHDFLKGIDIVVNAAGILDGAHWEKEVVTNVIGTIRSTLLAYKYAGKEGHGFGGIIVNISGIYGLDPLPQAPTYAACQHAILGFSTSFGDKQHEERSGLRMVALCPGFTRTKLLQNLEKKGMTDLMGRELQKKVDKSKMQKKDACGEAIVHLVKYAATGTVWMVDGSRLFFVERPKRDKCKKLVAQFL